jgi:hypothetical protein
MLNLTLFVSLSISRRFLLEQVHEALVVLHCVLGKLDVKRLVGVLGEQHNSRISNDSHSLGLVLV